MHRIIIMRPLTYLDTQADHITDLGVINPMNIDHDPKAKTVMDALLSENLVGKCFVPGTYVITDEEERDFTITIQHTLAIKASRNGLISCKVFDLNKAATVQGAMGGLRAAEGKVVMRYDDKPGLRFEADTSRKFYKHKLYQAKLADVIDQSLYEYSKIFPVAHLAVGAPMCGTVNNQYSMSLLPIRRVHAGDLFDLVTNDTSFKLNMESERLTTLTIEDRFEITIALFEALYEQVFKYGLLHRDIKPENMLVYKDANGWKVIIEDYDFCMMQTEKSRGSVGTPQYVAPEVLFQKYSEASDIMSAGLTACFLFHDKEQLILAAEEDARRIFELRKPSLEHGKTVNLMIDQKELCELLTDCTRANDQQRPDIHTCIARIRHAYLVYLQQKNVAIQAALPAISEGVKLAEKTCRDILHISESEVADYTSLAVIMAKLTEIIAMVPDNAFAITAFANGLGIQRCQNVNDKAKLLSILSKICESYQSEYAHLMDEYDKLSNIKLELEEQGEEYYSTELNAYLNRLNLFCEVILATPVNFNAVAAATERMQHKSARLARDSFFATLTTGCNEVPAEEAVAKLSN